MSIRLNYSLRCFYGVFTVSFHAGISIWVGCRAALGVGLHEWDISSTLATLAPLESDFWRHK